MTHLERIIVYCKENKIPLSKIEKDLGYANGYLSGLKGELPIDRFMEISHYLKKSPFHFVDEKELEESSKTQDDIEYDEYCIALKSLSVDQRKMIYDQIDYQKSKETRLDA